MQLVLLHYNNYANRIYKAEDSVSDYLTASKGKYFIIDDYDFNPSDGVDTVLTIGGDVYDYDPIYDYLLVCDGDLILSRWFIGDSDRLRGGQYRTKLHRDVFADSWEFLHDAPAFIEKGSLNAGDPAIFNKEDMGFNQIKTEETLLKANTDMPWIVGYYARDTVAHSGTTANVSTVADIDLTNTTFESWEYAQYRNTDFYGEITDFECEFALKVNFINPTKYNYKFDKTSAGFKPASVGYNNFIKVDNVLGDEAHDRYGISLCQNNFIPHINNYIDLAYATNGRPTKASIEAFRAFDNKTVVFQGGKYYRISIVEGSEKEFANSYTTITEGSTLFNTLISDAQENQYYEGYDGTPFSYNTKHKTYRVVANYIGQGDYNWSIPAQRDHLIDAPYDAFAIPYGIYPFEGPLGKQMNETEALLVATSIAKEMATSVYDLQLLPYCPDELFELYINWSQHPNCFSYIKDSENNNAGVIFHMSKSSFTKKINVQIQVPDDPIEKKIMNETEVYRICSPNYNGVFEFSPAKNGTVPYFEVEATYLPYKPYIKVHPRFSGLYGRDFKDNRGLILGGDFSLAVVNDQWQQYQINNKNFENIFNRQITNLEFNQREEMKMAKFNALFGTLAGGAGGAAAGSTLGGIGAGFGAAVGAGAGIAGGIMDVARTGRMQAEAYDYKQDMFGYELGNIKARPDTLSKTTAYCIDNKYFPFLEKYTCTDIEKEALRNKIKYNGMTVMRIGTIDEFNKGDYNYVKGQFIRIEGICDDYHIVNTIKDEFNKGVYIR